VRGVCAERARTVRLHAAASFRRARTAESSIVETVAAMKRSEQQRLLEESYELALLRDADFPRLFYDILFQRHPSTRALFKSNSLNAQRTMLSKALLAAVDHLEDTHWLEQNLLPMGKEHLSYGVTAEMYGWVGDALIAAIAEVCEDDWTAAHESAWRDAYRRMAEIMRRGEST
jgi:hemoglobin-like flavoprotein